MRNRLNVYFRGNRTTVRFPHYLWDLALIAKGFTDDQLVEFVKRDLIDSVSPGSPSDILKQCLIFLIEDALTPAGFNPGNSRAPVPGKALPAKAAEARHRFGMS